MTSTEALIVTLLPTLSIFSFVAITLETTIENNLTKILEIFKRNVNDGFHYYEKIVFGITQ